MMHPSVTAAQAAVSLVLLLELVDGVDCVAMSISATASAASNARHAADPRKVRRPPAAMIEPVVSPFRRYSPLPETKFM